MHHPSLRQQGSRGRHNRSVSTSAVDWLTWQQGNGDWASRPQGQQVCLQQLTPLELTADWFAMPSTKAGADQQQQQSQSQQQLVQQQQQGVEGLGAPHAAAAGGSGGAQGRVLGPPAELAAWSRSTQAYPSEVAQWGDSLLGANGGSSSSSSAGQRHRRRHSDVAALSGHLAQGQLGGGFGQL
jgi:hypothetical protein